MNDGRSMLLICNTPKNNLKYLLKTTMERKKNLIVEKLVWVFQFLLVDIVSRYFFKGKLNCLMINDFDFMSSIEKLDHHQSIEGYRICNFII